MTMRTKLCLLQLALLVLVLDIATRDVTASKANSSEEERVVYQNRSENNMNAIEYHLPLQQKAKTVSVTAGNSQCRSGSSCGYHQRSSYSYCYVDYSNNWDYCCTGSCDYHGNKYMWCESGNKWQYCSDAGSIGIDGISCYYSHPCGMHQEFGKEKFYWCYIDHKKNWRRCCRPSSRCDYYGESYKWCYTGRDIDTDWQYCN